MSVEDLYRTRCGEPSDVRAHMPTLRRLVRWTRSRVVIELGVRDGYSTVALLAGLPSNGRLWSCDHSRTIVPSEVEQDPRWTLAVADDLAAARAAPRRCGLLFIDTSHEYEHTRDELRLYGPRVRSGGAIVLHDTELGDVTQAVRDWLRAHRRHGYVEDQRDHGLGVILV